MLIENIDGIGKNSIEYLNTINIKDTEDIKKMGWKNLANIKYLGIEKIFQLCKASGIDVSKSEIFKYRKSLNINKLNKTPIIKNKTQQLVIKKSEFNISKLIEILEKGKGRLCWKIANFTGIFALVEFTEKDKLENLLINEFPEQNPNTILNDAFTKLDYRVG